MQKDDSMRCVLENQVVIMDALHVLLDNFSERNSDAQYALDNIFIRSSMTDEVLDYMRNKRS